MIIFNKIEKPVDIKEAIDYKKISKIKDITKGFILKPNDLVLGITKEKITLPEDICGWLQSRSRFARVGLMSHITAPFVNPGTESRQVLEIFNAGHNNLKLHPGIKVCQLVLETCKGKTKYKGKFKAQTL